MTEQLTAAERADRAFDLSGRVAVVTGGNSGIGLGIARALARAGADVAIWGRSIEKNRAAADDLASHGRRVVAEQCDVGEPSQVTAAMAATLQKLDKVDAFFANAGGVEGQPSAFTDMPYEEWRRIVRVNLDGVFLSLQAAAGHMVERGEGGSLVAMSSVMADTGFPRSQPYCACKAGILGMVRAIAVELAPHGIRANSLQPGFIVTPFVEAALAGDAFRTGILPRIPQQRWGTPDDIGGIAVYLASDASRYHTGDEIVVDGGFSAG